MLRPEPSFRHMVDCKHVTIPCLFSSPIPHNARVRLMPAGGGLCRGGEDGMVWTGRWTRKRGARRQGAACQYAKGNPARCSCTRSHSSADFFRDSDCVRGGTAGRGRSSCAKSVFSESHSRFSGSLLLSFDLLPSPARSFLIFHLHLSGIAVLP